MSFVPAEFQVVATEMLSIVPGRKLCAIREAISVKQSLP
jgi:hypothetical protein